MPENTTINITGRVLYKHFTAEEWTQEPNCNYIPRYSEIVLYDPVEPNKIPFIKIGDGITTVPNLPFYQDTSVSDWARQEDPPTGVYMGTDEKEIPGTCDVWIDPSQGVTSKVDYLDVLDITDQDTIDNFMINMPQYTTRNVLFSGSGISLGNTTIPQGSTGTITCGQNEAVLNLTDRNRNSYVGCWNKTENNWRVEPLKAASLKNINVPDIETLENLILNPSNFNGTYVLQFTQNISICVGTEANNEKTILLFKGISKGTIGILTINEYMFSTMFKTRLNLTYPDYCTSFSTDGRKADGYLSEDDTDETSYLLWQRDQRGPEYLTTHVVNDYESLAAIPIKYGFYNTYGIATNDIKPNGTKGDIVINLPAKDGGIIELFCSWSQGIMICDGDITIFLYDHNNQPRVLYGNTAADQLEPSKWNWHGKLLLGTDLTPTPSASSESE